MKTLKRRKKQADMMKREHGTAHWHKCAYVHLAAPPELGAAGLQRGDDL